MLALRESWIGISAVAAAEIRVFVIERRRSPLGLSMHPDEHQDELNAHRTALGYQAR